MFFILIVTVWFQSSLLVPPLIWRRAVTHVKTKCITSLSRLSAAFTDGLQLTNIPLQHMLILHYEYQSVISACGKNRSLFEETQALYKQAVCRKLTGV